MCGHYFAQYGFIKVSIFYWFFWKTSFLPFCAFCIFCLFCVEFNACNPYKLSNICIINFCIDLVYFTTRVPNTSDTSAAWTTQVRHEQETSETSVTRVRKNNISATWMRYECGTKEPSPTRVRHEQHKYNMSENFLFWQRHDWKHFFILRC